ncbi:probable protein S-acyltransferase 4 [Impatiens glandulifera]|uniref:probable protein S-acyltransferase 4 n=1 Tax=Impatiens glandulifera TaxID=253017 RepID=UPI001FB1193F|nr:probable protein S-acyltransferase 4 [Impatiens glandulifera]
MIEGDKSFVRSSSSTNNNVMSEIEIKPKRVYQLWKGTNKFFLGGRLIFGPDGASLFLSILLIAGPAIAFLVKVYFSISRTGAQHITLWYSVLAVGSILTILAITFLLLTASRDPGILPRNSKPPELDDPCEIPTPSMEWVNGRTPHLKLPRTKDVIVNGHMIKVKFCDTCLLYRLPRASHCSICNNCVQRFDHHCPWVGQCIGIRNYRFFYMFILTSTILCIFVFTFSWMNIIWKEGKVLKAMRHDIFSVFLIVYCFIAVWFVGGLTIFHFYLICTNQTTYENFRNRYDKKENPYNKGTMSNLREVFLSKIPPSLIDFRSIAHEEAICMDHITPIIRDNLEDYSKEKLDNELRSKLTEDDDALSSLPSILKNLDYGDIEENVKIREDNEIEFIFPIEEESLIGVENHVIQIGVIENGASRKED